MHSELETQRRVALDTLALNTVFLDCQAVSEKRSPHSELHMQCELSGGH